MRASWTRTANCTIPNSSVPVTAMRESYIKIMGDDIASLVYPVIGHGLRLKERISRGERPNILNEQAALKGLLGSATQSAPWGTDGAPITTSVAPGGRSGSFLGI